MSSVDLETSTAQAKWLRRLIFGARATGTESSAATQESAGQNGMNVAYWEQVRSAFPEHIRPPALAREGSVGNRVVFRLSNDKVPRLSALELLGPTAVFSADRLRPWVTDRIVVIGQTFDEAGDRWNTPLGPMPGAVILINAIDSMIEHQLLRPQADLLTLLSCVGVIVGAGYVFARWSLGPAGLIATLTVLLVLGISSVLLLGHGLWLDFVAPVVGIKIHTWFDNIKAQRLARKQMNSAGAFK